MDEKIVIMKTRNLLPIIEKLIEIENSGGSDILMKTDDFKSFDKFIDEINKSLKKPVKYVFRSR
jgi:queuine/archaeosine tRNA-ribosyltransferase